MQEKPLVIITFLLALNLTGCNTTNSSSTKVRYYDWSGLDAQLPNGTNSTPAHNLPRYEYPFDSKGKYVSSWAAEGNKRLGTRSSTSRGSTRKRSSRNTSTVTSSKSHRIVAGDTLYGLARKYGTSVNAIKRANGMTSDVIIKGKTIRIP